MSLRWYQSEAIDSLFQYFRDGPSTPEIERNPIVALPTGTGKSHVIGGFCQRALYEYPETRILGLTHVKELIKQDTDKITDMWPNAPLGVYSSGLKQYDTQQPIIFGGMKSVINNLAAFGRRDIIKIDECHLLSPAEATTYQTIIGYFKALNPWLKVIGYTATKWRTGQGLLTNSLLDENGNDRRIFTDICYDMTDTAGFARLLAEGFISPLIPKRTHLELDVSKVGMNWAKGDFAQGQLQKAVDKTEITYQALLESCHYGQSRNAWLCFASGVEHCDHIADMLNSWGIPATSIHSKMQLRGFDRDTEVAKFKAGVYRCAVTNNILTTGFDYPPVDMIIMLRPTMSAGLWVQMLGRGTRPSPDTFKANCLVLDFARNTLRLGPINDPRIPGKKGAGTGELPVKICERCGAYNHISVRWCCDCGAEFEFEVKIVKEAGTHELITADIPQIETFDVHHCIYARHVSKKSGGVSVKASYFTGIRTFYEWVNFESPYSGIKHKSHEWWKQRHVSAPPQTNDEALHYIEQLRTPRRIRVWVNKDSGKFPEVVSYEY
jgi:DNA repair protein RadD